jgi:hypothetical protein
MKQFYSLLKASFASSVPYKKNKKGKLNSSRTLAIPQLLLAVFIAAFMSYSYARNLIDYRNAGLDVRFIEKYLQIAISCSSIYCFFFSLAFSASIYFDSNNDAFLCLPITGGKLYLVRLTLNFMYSFMYGGLLLLSQFIITCIVLNLNALNYIMAVLVFIGILVTINFLSFSISNLVSRIRNLQAYKNFASVFTFCCTALGAIALVGLVFFRPISRTTLSYQENLNQLVGNINSLYNITYFINWAGLISTKSVMLLDSSYYIYILYGGIIDIVLIVVGYIIANFYYIKNLNSGYKRSSRKDKKKMSYHLDKAFRKRKQINIFIRKEFMLLKSNPLIIFNSMFTCITSTVASILIAYFLFKEMKNQNNSDLGMLFVNGLLLTSIIIPNITFASVSMEGSGFTMLKAIPLDTKKYTIAKMVPSVTITLIYTLIICIIFFFMFPFEWYEVLCDLFLVFSIALCMSAFSFYLGSRLPNFSYSSSAELQKGLGPVIVSIFNLFASIFTAGIGIGVAIGTNIYVLRFIGYGIACILWFGLTQLFFKLSIKQVDKLIKEDLV